MSSKNPLPSVAELQRCFEYEAATGRLLWRVREEVAAHVNSRLVGREAGSPNTRGYRQIEFNGGVYCAHRIIFKMHHGYEPEGDVDHRDTDNGNDRIGNLRDSTHQQNGRNSKKQARHGLKKGVTRRKRDGKFYAQITLTSGRKHLGSFGTEDQAHDAYVAAAKKHFGEFARAA